MLGLNSRTYQRVMRAGSAVDAGSGRYGVGDSGCGHSGAAGAGVSGLPAGGGGHRAHVDLPVPGGGCRAIFDLYAFDPRKLYINFGFWDVRPSAFEPGHYNREVERKLVEMGGKKGLYSSVYFDAETFADLYNGMRYAELKARYDPDGAFRSLYDKCVRP